MKRKKFVFVAHWVENWNWLLWFSKDLHKNPENAKWWAWFAPVYYLMSVIYLMGKRDFDEVDNYQYRQLAGKTYLLRNFGWHFFVKSSRKKIKQRILRTVLAAQEAGADVVGLGALTKAEWLTQGGKYIVDKLGDKLRIPVVHGDTLTAAAVIFQIHRLIRKFDIATPVFLTGATSKIGRAVAISLAQKGVTVKMFTNSQERFAEIAAEAGDFAVNLIHAKTLADGKDCQLWATGKAIPGWKVLVKYIPENAVVVNFSVPNPLTLNALKMRRDIYAVEGGLLEYDPATTSLAFTMRLTHGTTYACHAGTMVHADMGWTHHEVGPVNISELSVTWDAAVKLGFDLPRLPAAKGETETESTQWQVRWSRLAKNVHLFL